MPPRACLSTVRGSRGGRRGCPPHGLRVVWVLVVACAACGLLNVVGGAIRLFDLLASPFLNRGGWWSFGTTASHPGVRSGWFNVDGVSHAFVRRRQVFVAGFVFG